MPLLSVFKSQIIPWTAQFGCERVIAAPPSWQALQGEHGFPLGVTASHKPLRSKRTPVKGRRQFGNAALIDAHWPKDHLQSGRAPMLIYTLSGATAFPLGDYEIYCKPGYAVLIPPGLAHSDGSHLFLDSAVKDNSACRLLMIRPYNAGIECWLSHTQNDEHYSHRNVGESCRLPCGRAVLYMEVLCEEVLQRENHYREICDATLLALMNLLLRELEKAPRPQSAAMPVTESWAPSDAPIARAQQYIRSHLGEDISLDSMARAMYMSRRRFSDQFRQQTGQSFLEYLTDCRYQEACNLLQNTDWSIEIISGFVGIKTGRLRALFHQRAGVSPTMFRQNKIPKNDE